MSDGPYHLWGIKAGRGGRVRGILIFLPDSISCCLVPSSGRASRNGQKVLNAWMRRHWEALERLHARLYTNY